MRSMIRVFVSVGACAALLALPTRGQAAPVDAAHVWAAPTQLVTRNLRYGDFTGEVEAQRSGIGPGSAQVCVRFSKNATQRDGSTRHDTFAGCNNDAKQSAYAFDPVRWKGLVAVSVSLERWSVVDYGDRVVTEQAPTPAGAARLELRWTGIGRADVQHAAGGSLVLLVPVWVRLTATKHAAVNGTLRIGSDVVRLTHASGLMRQGEET
jgi:hypothetical protein